MPVLIHPFYPGEIFNWPYLWGHSCITLKKEGILGYATDRLRLRFFSWYIWTVCFKPFLSDISFEPIARKSVGKANLRKIIFYAEIGFPEKKILEETVVSSNGICSFWKHRCFSVGCLMLTKILYLVRRMGKTEERSCWENTSRRVLGGRRGQEYLLASRFTLPLHQSTSRTPTSYVPL